MNSVRPDFEISASQAATINEGPFAGIKGTIVKSSGRRMRIAINFPDGPIEIEMDCSKVIAARAARRPSPEKARAVAA